LLSFFQLDPTPPPHPSSTFSCILIHERAKTFTLLSIRLCRRLIRLLGLGPRSLSALSWTGPPPGGRRRQSGVKGAGSAGVGGADRVSQEVWTAEEDNLVIEAQVRVFRSKHCGYSAGIPKHSECKQVKDGFGVRCGSNGLKAAGSEARRGFGPEHPSGDPCEAGWPTMTSGDSR
jgi:hypothetical protein